MRLLLAGGLALVLAGALSAEAHWRQSDALGNDRGPAPRSSAGPGWVLRIEATPGREERTLFHDGNADSLRLLDLDPAGRVVRLQDLRGGVAVWEVTYDASTGLPVTETLFQDNQPVEVSRLEFQDRTLVRRIVANAAGEEQFRDQFWHWPDGSLRRLERDGPKGPLAEASWSYGPDGRLTRAWASDEDERPEGVHREWDYAPGRTEERLVKDAKVTATRLTEALEGATRETKTDSATERKEVRTLDKNGRVTEEAVTVKGALLQTRTWTYDDKGRVLTARVASAGPEELWTYRYQDTVALGVLTRDGIVAREEWVRDGEKETVKWYDRGVLFLEETWSAGKRVKESYYQDGVVVRVRTP